jgi:excisionase family DNA binding protein
VPDLPAARAGAAPAGRWLLDAGVPVPPGVTTPAEELALHVSAALVAHVRQLHRDGLPVPPGLLDFARLVATARHTPPEVDRRPSRVDRVPMPPIAVDYATAAAALGVSVRTVSRRVAAGALPATGTGRGRRIPVNALTDHATPEDRA